MLIQMSAEYDIIELESFLVTPILVSEQATKRREYHLPSLVRLNEVGSYQLVLGQLVH